MECPFCLKTNRCSAHREYCWCFNADIPNELLKLVPEETMNQVCVCEKCVLKYHQDKEDFIRCFLNRE